MTNDELIELEERARKAFHWPSADQSADDRKVIESIGPLITALREARAEAEMQGAEALRQMRYGIKQHEYAQHALRMADAEIDESSKMAEKLRAAEHERDELRELLRKAAAGLRAAQTLADEHPCCGEPTDFSSLGERVEALLKEGEK
jgi:hypothetical protein